MLRSSGSAPDTYPTFAVLALNQTTHPRRSCLVIHRGLSASLILAATLLTVACTRHPESAMDDDAILFADVIDFQAHNLTTDLISVPEGLGLAAVDHGWQRGDDPDSNDAWLAVKGKLGRLLIFSADGDLQELELELSLGNTEERQKLPVQVFLNDSRVERLHPKPDWASYTVPVPPDLVRRGVNILELAPRSGNRRDDNPRGPQIRLRRLRLRSGKGRPVWPARPQEIRTGDGLEMPVASYLDLVLEVPQDGRILGNYEVEIAEPDSGPAYAYLQLLDEAGKERTLLNKRLLKTVRRERQIDLDLSSWSGQIVRVRIGTTGPGNGVVHWQDLRVAGPQTVEPSIPLPPIPRSDVARSGRLGKPDVLVILLDAARADVFSPFGGPHPTPATERLAGDGTAFEKALSPAPWTGQSVPSMLTGLYPDSLRVGPLGSRLPDGVPTLPELMMANGYHTVLWSQHPLYRNHKSFQRGFEAVHRTYAGAFGALPTAQDLLDDERPTFAWVHLIPPHAPYRPPAPFAGSYTSWYSGSTSVEAEFLGLFPHSEDPESLSAADLQYSKDRYQENVAFADSLVARLLAELESQGRYRTSLIVLLSDHGEAFLEHGIFLHTRNLHTELLHVPLVIKWPADLDGFASRIPTPVGLVDLVPTLVDGLGLVGADDGFQGTSLLSGVFGGAAAAQSLYAVTRGVEDRRKAPKPGIMLQSGPWRILYDPLRDSTKLFNLHDDPGETTDLSLDQPLRTLLLRQGLLSQQHSNRQLLGGLATEEVVEEIDPEVVEQLKALGYLK